MIDRNFKFKVKTVTLENVYPIKFPTAGDLYDIEIRKASLSVGMYSSIIAANTQISVHVLDGMDMQATLEILCPGLIEDLPDGIKSIRDLDIIDHKQLLKQFKDQVLPWQNAWMKTLSEVPDENEKPEPDSEEVK